MKYYLVISICIGAFVCACKKEEVPLKPTSLTLQVIYQKTGLPVDSAEVLINGTKGAVLSGAELQTFKRGYTDAKGTFSTQLMIPREYYTTLTVGKLVKLGNRYIGYHPVAFIPDNTDELRLETESTITVKLDTLP